LVLFSVWQTENSKFDATISSPNWQQQDENYYFQFGISFVVRFTRWQHKR